MTEQEQPVGGWCDLCDERFQNYALEAIKHLELMHPDAIGDGFERWPDGSCVVYDETLEPRDFVEEDAQ